MVTFLLIENIYVVIVYVDEVVIYNDTGDILQND
jgi:hypothetical protein